MDSMPRWQNGIALACRARDPTRSLGGSIPPLGAKEREHGVSGNTAVSKTVAEGSSPSAPAREEASPNGMAAAC